MTIVDIPASIAASGEAEIDYINPYNFKGVSLNCSGRIMYKRMRALYGKRFRLWDL